MVRVSGRDAASCGAKSGEGRKDGGEEGGGGGRAKRALDLARIDPLTWNPGISDDPIFRRLVFRVGTIRTSPSPSRLGSHRFPGGSELYDALDFPGALSSLSREIPLSLLPSSPRSRLHTSRIARRDVKWPRRAMFVASRSRELRGMTRTS